MSIIKRLALIEWSFAMIPKPVQGASSNTRSKVPGKIVPNLRPSLHVTAVLVTPNRYKLNCKALRRSFFKSLAKTLPVFFINWAM